MKPQVSNSFKTALNFLILLNTELNLLDIHIKGSSIDSVTVFEREMIHGSCDGIF